MAKSYEERKEQINEIQKEQRRKGRDIGPLPEVVDLKRKASCRLNLKLFCLSYFPAVFYYGFSPDHLKAIKIIEQAVLKGGTFSMAMPRGTGKTELAKKATEWAKLYGHHAFSLLIGASATHAEELLDSVKTDFEVNDLLLADFPEVCWPIRCLEGRASNADGQLLDGERTRITWTKDAVVLPTVPGSAASGSVIRVAGITGRIRGMQATRASDGATIRPTWIVIDDPQTEESAGSSGQVKKRLATITGAVMGLAGPGKKLAAVMPVTVIEKDDLADRILDREKYPDWQGYRTKLLKSEPINVKLWEQYAELRAKGLRNEQGIGEATKFYKQNRKTMDEGAEASWHERFNDDEISAIQNCMNLKLKDEYAFQAEYQNEPISSAALTPLMLKPNQVAAKALDGYPRGIVPEWATRLTAFIDVHPAAMYYLVLASGPEFTAHVVDYGCYPDQGQGYFLHRDVRTTLQDVSEAKSEESAIYEGLAKLTSRLLSNPYQKLDDNPLPVSRLLIDSGYQTSTVNLFVKQGGYRAIVAPSKGLGLKAQNKPMAEYQSKLGERKGWNWRVEANGLFQFDANEWKTFVTQRILLSPGDGGNLSIYQGSDIQHRMFAEHVTNEYPTAGFGWGRWCNAWNQRPGRDNHLLDCLVGAYVAASEQGITATGHASPKLPAKRKRKPVQVNWG